MTEHTTNWWEAPAAEEFRSVAHRYMTVIDEREHYSASALLRLLHPLLAQLYLVALSLPVEPEETADEIEEIDEDEEFTPDKPRTPEESEQFLKGWKALADSLAQQIGPQWDLYREMFDPYATTPDEPVTFLLSMDLTEIYLDLRNGEALWTRGEKQGAVLEWRSSFEIHWSRHTTSALSAIRALAAHYDLGF